MFFLDGKGEGMVVIAYPELLHYKIDDLKIRNILKKLVDYLLVEFKVFAESVVETYPTLRMSYNIYIEYPCDLTKMMARLKNESPIRYLYVGQVIRDFELISTNCEIFNHTNKTLLGDAWHFREYYFWILQKMLSRVGIEVTGSYKEMISELSKFFPISSTMCIDGHLFPVTSTRAKNPTEDCISILYAHMRVLPEAWQSALIWGVILIADATRKYKASTSNIDIDITDIPEAYSWLRNQIIQYERLVASGIAPEDVPTWQEAAHLVGRKDCEIEISDSSDRDSGDQGGSIGEDQLSLPELSDDVLEAKEETNSRKRRR